MTPAVHERSSAVVLMMCVNNTLLGAISPSEKMFLYCDFQSREVRGGARLPADADTSVLHHSQPIHLIMLHVNVV